MRFSSKNITIYLLFLSVMSSCSSLNSSSSPQRSLASVHDRVALFGGGHMAKDFGEILAAELSSSFAVERFAFQGNSSHISLMAGKIPVQNFRHDLFVSGQKIRDLDESSIKTVGRDFAEEFFSEGKFKTVFLQLMDYQLLFSADENKESIREILGLAEASGETCYFISSGPPAQNQAQTYTQLSVEKKREFIDQVLKPTMAESKCKLIDSLKLLEGREISAQDGLHYSSSSARLWVNEVLKEMQKGGEGPSASAGLKLGFYGESHAAQKFGDGVVTALASLGDVKRLAVGGLSTHTALRSQNLILNAGYKSDEVSQGAEASDSRPVSQGLQVSRSLTENFLYRNNQFDVIVLMFMDNQLGYASSSNRRSVEAMVRLAERHSRSCVYISANHKGRPASGARDLYANISQTQKQNFVNQVLKPVLENSKCHLVNSLDLMSFNEVRTVDGLHLNRTANEAWSEAVSPVLLEFIREDLDL